MWDFNNKTIANFGIRYLIECPYSEVCVSMDVDGKQMYAELIKSPAWGAMVQLYTLDGRPFSSPTLTGEAGFYSVPSHQCSPEYQYYCTRTDVEVRHFYPPRDPVAPLRVFMQREKPLY